ncbi:holin [Gilliamella apicola]|uniref:Holin n=1 Tax=Gilliamella apicola TaxID=1196095 RepID=A0A556RSD9_9GAMM|nr:holin [Gilliamella apicola]TSJ91754.1 holin [Gilliamella apicola]
MTDDEKLLVKIGLIGFMLGIAKLLAGDEAITWRKVIGRALLGTGSSLIAGLVMIPHPNASQLVVVGAAALLGILGHSFIEWIVINYIDKKNKKD